MRGATTNTETDKGHDNISIHAPHAGRDAEAARNSVKLLPFQSTRPVRGATPAAVYCDIRDEISIHAPRAGRDRGPGGAWAVD